MPNEYVDFVSDFHFEKCVKQVCNAYPKESKNIDMKYLQRNVLDTFKLLFDMKNSKIELNTWLMSETVRQLDKTNGNWIGKFHQSILGGVKGWSDLDKPRYKKIKEQTKVDLMKNDKTVFLEIKNKWNTKTGTDMENQYQKLEKVTKKFKKSTVYFAFITNKNGTSKDTVWKRRGKKDNPKIRKIWSSKFYTLITGKEDSLEQTWKALPKVMNKVLKSKDSFSKRDQKSIEGLFKYALTRI